MKPNRFESATFFAVVAGLGCFLLSFVAMGLAPWTSLKRMTDQAKSAANPYVDEKGELNSVGRGRQLYIKEACWHCHSQFVRPVAGEPFRYGPPSQAWESMFDIPQTFGTRRIGPDLSREAGRRSNDWQLAHLYNPRSTTPLSVMPGYPWYFDETATDVRPKQEALDLVSYLQYLGSSFKDEIQSIVYPRLFKVTGYPVKDEVHQERGRQLFTENCTGCHGTSGNGMGLAQPALRPKPASLSDRYVSPSEVYSVLNRGVLGSAMPSFREMPERDLWALSLFVSELGESHHSITKNTGHDSQRVQRGSAHFKALCVACHGTQGTGDGPAAVALNPRPKDFSRRVFSPTLFRTIMHEGVPGSAMPAFAQLDETKTAELEAYVQTLFVDER